MASEPDVAEATTVASVAEIEDVEDIDDDGPEVEEIDDLPIPAGSSSDFFELQVEGIEDDEGEGGHMSLDFGGDAAAAAAAAAVAAPPDDGKPRALKHWLLPPSLTPKRGRPRGMPPPIVTFDLEVRASEDGAWRCGACGATYEARVGLFAHTRFCSGRAAAWACEWCGCSEGETNHKATGPSGAKTLCSACSQRYRHGADGMPTQNDKGEYLCATCHRCFTTMSALGAHRRFCDGGTWRCGWCECKAGECGGKGPGPDGAMTLCTACSARYRAGHTGPPPRNEEGKYVCERCERTFDTIPGLGSHRKRCDGGAWRCSWCECKAEDTSGKGPGPEGGKTLCSLCSARWRAGHTAAPPTNADGRYPCERCERTFETFRALGVHSRDCDGGAWRCSWCECKAEDTSGKGPGPLGPRTLCSACGCRYRAGHSGPPPKTEDGSYMCDKCGRSFDNIPSLGGHRRHCVGVRSPANFGGAAASSPAGKW